MTCSVAATGPQERRHYWLREDFEELVSAIPEAGRLDAGDKAASVSLVYPKDTTAVAAELQFRGLRGSPCQLFELVARRVVNPGGIGSGKMDEEKMARLRGPASNPPVLHWDRPDVDAAAEWFDKRRYWTTWTHFCCMANLRFGQAVDAYRAFCTANGKGFQLGIDLRGMVTAIEPDPAGEGYAHVRFFPAGTRLSQA
jgi:hypothetical protein